MKYLSKFDVKADYEMMKNKAFKGILKNVSLTKDGDKVNYFNAVKIIDNTFIISAASGLKWISDECIRGNVFANKKVILMEDINMSFYESFVSINNFEGEFDGNGFIISELSNALFDINKGKIINVIVKDSLVNDNAIISKNNQGILKNNYNINCAIDGEIISAYNSKDGKTFEGEIIKLNELSGIVELNEPKDYILLGDNKSLDIKVNTGCDVICMHNEINNIIVKNNSRQKGFLKTSSVEFDSGCGLSEFGVKNSGCITYNLTSIIYSAKSGTGWLSLCMPFNFQILINDILMTPIVTGGKGAYWFRTIKSKPDGVYGFLMSSLSSWSPDEYMSAFNNYALSIPGSAFGANSLQDLPCKLVGKGDILPNEEKLEDFNIINVLPESIYTSKFILDNYEKETKFNKFYLLNSLHESDVYTGGNGASFTQLINTSENYPLTTDNIIHPYRVMIYMPQNKESLFSFTDIEQELKINENDLI